MVHKIEQEYILLLGIVLRIRKLFLRGSAENTHAAQVRSTHGFGALRGRLFLCVEAYFVGAMLCFFMHIFQHFSTLTP